MAQWVVWRGLLTLVHRLTHGKSLSSLVGGRRGSRVGRRRRLYSCEVAPLRSLDLVGGEVLEQSLFLLVF